jgi:hypothetical protein
MTSNELAVGGTCCARIVVGSSHGVLLLQCVAVVRVQYLCQQWLPM